MHPFLNLSNLVIIDSYLYKITPDKKIIITSGDVDELDDAEELEESDPENGIYIITFRSCLCDNTHEQWKYVKTISNGDNNGSVRSINTLIFSDLSLVSINAPQQKATITPYWTIETNIKIQKKGAFGWHLERKNILFQRQVNITHNFNTANTMLLSDGSWNESTGWTTATEGDFNYNTSYKYEKYETGTSSYMPLGYCFAVRIFHQQGNIPSPSLTNMFYYGQFPYSDFSGNHPLAPSIACPQSDPLYF